MDERATGSAGPASELRAAVERMAAEQVPALADPCAAEDGERARDAAARIAWSAVLEPGDRVGGALIARLGAGEALARASWAAARAGGGDSAARAAAEQLADVAELDPTELREGLERWTPRFDGARIRRLADAALRIGAALVVPGDAAWPEQLADLDSHAPAALWVRGDPTCLRAVGAAIVGARAATSYGEGAAVELAAGLVERGVAVISGGAYGIDGAAHRAALALDGTTVAVMAGGPDRLYPAGHRELLERIIAVGALVSELPCGQAPTRWRFLQRNRIVAALGQATVVVEAGARSGALNTAGHAATMGRPIGAVPGPVTSAASEGCHRLIRDSGAMLVRGPADVLELMTPLDALELPGLESDGQPRAESGASTSEDDDPIRRRVRDALRVRRSIGVAELATASGLAVAEVLAGLTSLELDGRAIRDGEGWRAVAARRAA